MEQLHSFDRPSRRYTGPSPLSSVILDPVNQKAQPANTLPKAPPKPGKNQTVLANETYTDWELVADYTGTVYQKADGQPIEHKELGELPEHLTTQKPQTQWDEWQEEQGNWQTNAKARQQDLCNRYCTQLDNMASQVRQRFISGSEDVMEEYRLAKQEAEAYKAAGYKGEIPDTIQSDMESTGQTAKEAADSIIAMDEQGRTMLKTVRRLRLNGKAAIKALPEQATEEQFKEEYTVWQTKLDAIKPTS